MRIYIRERGGRRFVIPVPMFIARAALALGKFGVNIGHRYVDENTRRYLEIIDFWALSKCIKELSYYKGLTLLEVKSEDGDEVIIKI